MGKYDPILHKWIIEPDHQKWQAREREHANEVSIVLLHACHDPGKDLNSLSHYPSRMGVSAPRGSAVIHCHVCHTWTCCVQTQCCSWYGLCHSSSTSAVVRRTLHAHPQVARHIPLLDQLLFGPVDGLQAIRHAHHRQHDLTPCVFC